MVSAQCSTRGNGGESDASLTSQPRCRSHANHHAHGVDRSDRLRRRRRRHIRPDRDRAGPPHGDRQRPGRRRSRAERHRLRARLQQRPRPRPLVGAASTRSSGRPRRPACATSGCSRPTPACRSSARSWSPTPTTPPSSASTATVTRNLDGFDVTPAVTRRRGAGGRPGRPRRRQRRAYRDEASSLVILPGDDGEGARLAWRVEFRRPAPARVDAGLWNYFVDARDGARAPQAQRPPDPVEQASGPGGNAKTSRTWTAELDVEEDGAEFAMDTDAAQDRRRQPTATRWSRARLENMATRRPTTPTATPRSPST